MDHMMKSVTLNVKSRITPLVKYEVKRLLAVQHIVVNGGGGMGGSREHFYGTVTKRGKAESWDTDFWDVKLTVTNRKIRLNPEYMGRVEEVALWEEKITHKNGNFTSPLVNHFIAHVDTELKAVSGQSHEDSPEKIFGFLTGCNF
jgi:hypothetical protein